MSTLNATFPCLMVIFAKGEELDNPQYVHLHNEDDARRMYARFEEKHKANGWHCTAVVHYYSTEYTATAEEHHADVDACLAEPNSSAAEPKPTYEQLEAKIVLLEGWLSERRKQVDSLYRESRSPRGTVEMLQQELRVEREKVADLRSQLWDRGGQILKLEEELAKHKNRRKKAVVCGAPVAGMTFPFVLPTPNRDLVEITVHGVDSTDGNHQVHMTATIQFPEAQPQEVPSHVVEPDAPTENVVGGNTVGLDDAPGIREWEQSCAAAMANEEDRLIAAKVKEVLKAGGDLLAYEQAGAMPDNAPKLTATGTNEPAASHTTLTFGGVTINVDGDKLLLTDMWRAAGSRNGKQPYEWLRQDGTKVFVEYLETTGLARSLTKTTEGRNGGTWAHWQIGMAYAKYLSPKFHVWCNSVVRAHMLGRVAPAVPASFVEPKSTMDWHKHLMEMHKQSMEREQTWHGTVRLLEEKNNKVVSLLKVENDGMAGVITAQYNELTEYRAFVKNDESDSGVSTVALSLGYNEQFFFSLMREHGLILNGRKGGWSYGLHTDPYKEHIDKGWFVVRPNLRYRKVHPYTKMVTIEQGYTTRITNLGAFELTRMYGKNGTHWNSDKPAASFHISPNNREVTEEERLDYQRKLWSVWDEEARAAGRPGKPFPEYKVTRKERE